MFIYNAAYKAERAWDDGAIIGLNKNRFYQSPNKWGNKDGDLIILQFLRGIYAEPVSTKHQGNRVHPSQFVQGTSKK
jgi:hypothetical protein